MKFALMKLLAEILVFIKKCVFIFSYLLKILFSKFNCRFFYNFILINDNNIIINFELLFLNFSIFLHIYILIFLITISLKKVSFLRVINYK